MSVDHDSRDILLSRSDDEFVPQPSAPVARSRWRRVPSARTVLIAALLATAGYAGGVLTAKHEGVTTNAAPRAATTGARTGTGTAAGFGAAAGQPAAAGGSDATVGTVKLVNGSTIYLTTTDGSVVKVTTNGATKLALSETGTTANLKAGETVVVQGTTDSSGGVAATSVTQSAATTAR